MKKRFWLIWKSKAIIDKIGYFIVKLGYVFLESRKGIIIYKEIRDALIVEGFTDPIEYTPDENYLNIKNHKENCDRGLFCGVRFFKQWEVYWTNRTRENDFYKKRPKEWVEKMRSLEVMKSEDRKKLIRYNCNAQCTGNNNNYPYNKYIYTLYIPLPLPFPRVPNDSERPLFFETIIDLIKNTKDIMDCKIEIKEPQTKENKMVNELVKLLKENYNIVLTGAPGTGKTFLAKQIAMQMIGVDSPEELEKSGQVEFVQFHPSYDYTDFVEGLRPTEPDKKGNIGFELKDGIFKDFCQNALGAILVKDIEEFTLGNYEKYLESLGLVEITIKNYFHRIEQLLGKDLNARKDIVGRVIYTSLDDICDNIDNIKDFDKNNNFHYQFYAAVSNLNNFKKSLCKKDYIIDKNKINYIFIIDEINRGEISKIFGELFFSIDPGYRGKKGGVNTQYSNMHKSEEKFYIPENVYIIGTMNDIDRSVESFDFAMRRRFTWKEITAEQSIKNMPLDEEAGKRLARLNFRISKIEGLNSSYHIGGAYFLDKEGKQRKEYDKIWELRLEPLLREYLRGRQKIEEEMSNLKRTYENTN